MERILITPDQQSHRDFRAPKWALPALLTAFALMSSAAYDNTDATIPTVAPTISTPTTEYKIPNEPNKDGVYATNARPGTSAPFKTPNWNEHKQIEFRNVDPSSDISKETLIYIRKEPNQGISIEIYSFTSTLKTEGKSKKVTYGETTIQHNQTTIIANPLNEACSYNVKNTGKQPKVEEICK